MTRQGGGVQRAVSPGLASPIGVLSVRNDLDLDRGVLLERVDRKLDPLVRRRLDTDERLPVADILSKALAWPYQLVNMAPSLAMRSMFGVGWPSAAPPR